MENTGGLRTEGESARAPVGIVPIVTGAIQTRGASGLLGTFGSSGGVAILGVLTLVEAFLSVTRPGEGD